MENKLREVKLTYQPKKTELSGVKINSSETAFRYIRKAYDNSTIALKEEFIVLFLDRGNSPIGIHRLSMGGLDSTIVDIRLLMSLALKTLSSGIILSHNHPSGQLIESAPDKIVTKRIKKACELLDISLLDHIIVDPFDGFLSFADKGIL